MKAMIPLILVIALVLVTGCVDQISPGSCLKDSDCPVPTIYSPNGYIKGYCENFQCKTQNVCNEGYEFVNGSGCVLSYPETTCSSAGGEWREFTNGCVDSCELAANPLLACTMAMTMGCDCGADKCWNGTACVSNPEIDLESACFNSGGTVTTSLCCLSASDFPRMDVIGACGCSPENSHEVKTCDCGANAVWNGATCVVAGDPIE